MEHINPHFRATPPYSYLRAPMDCKYYAGGSCLGEKYAPICKGEECEKYMFSRVP